MSKYSERATMALHTMIREMYRKDIELSRITKCATQLLMAGVTANSIPKKILKECLQSQREDGGFVANADTIWNIKFLSYYDEAKEAREKAINWLKKQTVGQGYGRSARDMGRIPVTGLAFYLIPEISCEEGLMWLEALWESEKNSLTYKASYTLLAFHENNYTPSNKELIDETVEWLLAQQEADGGFAPWKEHPVGSNVYCTAVSILALLKYIDNNAKVRECINKAYRYLCESQRINGIWAYHELEDGGAWGLRALNAVEQMEEEL